MKTSIVVAAVLLFPVPLAANAQKPRPEDTEIYKPVPVVVTPGKTDLDAPSDAVILFDGHDESQWVTVKDHAPADWDVHDGVLTVNKHAGNIETKRSFTNYQLHIEWKVPEGISGSGQARGNSGVFLSSTGPGDDGYEIQVLDSYNNATYVNGQAAAIYKQYPPLVNAMRPPGQWNVYDVIWTAPTFKPDGSLDTPAYVTALHNGVLVQNHVALLGPTLYIGKPSYKAHGPEPLKLQAHGDPSAPISFRNIWARPLPDAAQAHVP
ncbi:MAG: 3-keto-disaccharide hydrolase [Gemmatimonadaceae bacterium]